MFLGTDSPFHLIKCKSEDFITHGSTSDNLLVHILGVKACKLIWTYGKSITD